MDFNFSQPAPTPATLTDCHVLIAEMWLYGWLQEQAITKFKEKAAINSSNSSQPPSADSIADKARRRKEEKNNDDWRKRTAAYWENKRQGAQKGHVGAGRHLLSPEKVNEFIACYLPDACAACGGEVQSGKLGQRRQVCDLPVGKLWVTEYQIYKGRCDQCGARCRGEVPVGTPKGILGANALARIGTLTSKYRQSKRETQELLLDFFGLRLSVGCISHAEGIIAQALALSAAEVGAALQKNPFMHADETSFTRCWKLQWLWVATNGTLTFFRLFDKRNTESAEQLIGKDYAGFVITDRYAAYSWLPSSQRQYCWAHLKRDFTKLSERDNVQEAYVGQQLLAHFTSLFHSYRQLRDGKINTGAKRFLLETIRRFRRILRLGKAIRGTPTSTFCSKLMREWRSLWHFLRHKDIGPTNNLAERAVRHVVIWRKKCFGTQSKRGGHFVERSLTVVMSCRQQKRNVLEFISQCVQAFLGTGAYPALV
jgi:transposase